MFVRSILSIAAVIALGAGLSSCDKMKAMMGGSSADMRNAQIDVSGTPCSDSGKFSTLVLKDGKYSLGQYQFELFGDPKEGDVSGHTTTDAAPSTVFVGDCAIEGQTNQILFVYADGKRQGFASLTDNGKGLVQSFDLKDGTIEVEQNEGNPPTLSKTSYALLNGKLADLSPAAPDATATASNDDDLDTDTISFQTFHDKLQPYGTWLKHPRWGWVWRPSEAGFRPYTNGHWEDSDEYGSVWVSADPWGDTPYHYGRWGYDPNYGGWLWAPGYVWGPSWVVWRAGDDNIGWMPIPPGEWDGEGDYPDAYADWYGYRALYGAAFDAAAFYALWSFVPSAYIFDARLRYRIIDRRGYGRFIGRTRNWTRYGMVRGHLVSRAFDRARYRAAFHRGLPGGRHDFVGRHAGSFAAGRRIAVHERLNGGLHGAGAKGFGREAGMRGFSHASSMRAVSHSNAFTRGGSYRAGAYGRGSAMGGFAHGGSYRSGAMSGGNRAYGGGGMSGRGAGAMGGLGNHGGAMGGYGNRSGSGMGGFGNRGGAMGSGMGGLGHSGGGMGGGAMGGLGHQGGGMGGAMGGLGNRGGGMGAGGMGGFGRRSSGGGQHQNPPSGASGGGRHH
jgi:hypothetical protein